MVIDLANNLEWKDIFYSNPSDKRINEFNHFLKEYNNIYQDNFIRLYHGTSIKHNIVEEGLLPTSNTRKHSLQSTNGYVYLSVYPESAKVFGEFAYPQDDIVLYSVDIHIRFLKADLDQLANARYWKELNVSNKLVDSLVFGHGARVKGSIPNYALKLIGVYQLKNAS